MRVCEAKMIAAIKSGKSAVCGSNTRVVFNGHVASVYLHGNVIAEVSVGYQTVCVCRDDCGWRTVTTKSRLNALADAFGCERIYQHDHVWYIGGNKWHGCDMKVVWL